MRIEDDDDAFQHGWQKFSGMDNEKFDDNVSAESRLATGGVNTVEELCESHVGATLLEGVRRKGKIPNPKFCRSARGAHETVVFCLCAQQQ
jgi:hypothetical protein